MGIFIIRCSEGDFMRSCRFLDNDGCLKSGEWTDEGITFGDEKYDPETVNILPPVESNKLVCVSTNHTGHDVEFPDRPRLFVKTPNTLVGHGGTVTLLPGKEFIWEAELAAVIGDQCSNVAAETAMEHVDGFTCINDITNMSDNDKYGVRFKMFDDGGPIGPVVASPDLVPADAQITLRVNGEMKQDASRSGLRYSVAEIIEEITSYITLEPGDVIPTGTPPGVGRLEDGDSVSIEIEGIGRLEHDVEQAEPAPDPEFST
jgi:2-keto-4-pentenoate hydratase/2-oxohepta-3-ene-1,7-dioic acid hydratase in catechol pathway